MKERHARPIAKYNISTVARKNRYLITKQEYLAICTIARAYKAYRLRKQVSLMVNNRRRKALRMQLQRAEGASDKTQGNKEADNALLELEGSTEITVNRDDE